MLILPALDSIKDVLLLLLSEGFIVRLIHINLHLPNLILNRVQNLLEGHVYSIDGRLHSTICALESYSAHTVLNIHARMQQFIINRHSDDCLGIATLHLLSIDL